MKTKSKVAVKITVEDGDIHIKGLNQKRFKQYGMGTFMENVKPGEIEISKAALKLLKDSPEQSGLSAMDIFAGTPPVLSWFGLTLEAVVPPDAINMAEGAFNEWFKKSVVIVG